VLEAIEGRKTEILGSDYYGNASADVQQSVVRTLDQFIARVSGDQQIALIREQGNSFDETTYPSLLDQLVSSVQSRSDDTTDTEPTPVKQTVSVKTITAPDVHGVLESPEDVERYLDALRSALLSTLNDGKRIAL
jgi:hypothetical protein